MFGLPGDGINGIMEALRTRQDRVRFVQVRHEESAAFVVILAGRGALHASDELERTAETLGAPIVKPLLGKAAVPDDSPYTTGSIGLLGTRPSQEALEECDTLLMVGTSFPYIEFYPQPGQARAVQIELDPMRIGLRYPVEVGLVGDSHRTLQALRPLLDPHRDRSFLERAQKGMEDWRALMLERATRTDKPMKPQVVAHELGKRLRDDAIVTCDSGTIATWWARHTPARRGRMHTLSGNLATMANSVPYAIAAQIAYPERQVVAFVGDGGFSMLMAELATCVKYRLPVKIVIVKNNTLGQIKWEQMVFLGNLAGQCCNVAVVIDMSRFFNRVLEIDTTRRIARVEPGMVLDELRAATRPFGLTFGPDPSTHNHCALLQRLGLDAEILDSGCCGMAGSFGFERSHYDVSVQVGERVLLPRVRAAAPDTLIVADGFSCREPIAQLTDRRALHLADVLALALHGSLPAARPETAIVEARERALRAARRRAAVSAGAVLVADAAAVMASRWRRAA